MQYLPHYVISNQSHIEYNSSYETYRIQQLIWNISNTTAHMKHIEYNSSYGTYRIQPIRMQYLPHYVISNQSHIEYNSSYETNHFTTCRPFFLMNKLTHPLMNNQSECSIHHITSSVTNHITSRLAALSFVRTGSLLDGELFLLFFCFLTQWKLFC
jgi:hypothetical protein